MKSGHYTEWRRFKKGGKEAWRARGVTSFILYYIFLRKRKLPGNDRTLHKGNFIDGLVCCRSHNSISVRLRVLAVTQP